MFIDCNLFLTGNLLEAGGPPWELATQLSTIAGDRLEVVAWYNSFQQGELDKQRPKYALCVQMCP